MPTQIEYQPATENEVFRARRALWIMFVAVVPFLVNLLLLARLCIDPAWADKEIEELLSFLRASGRWH